MPLPKILKNIIRTGEPKSPGHRLSSPRLSHVSLSTTTNNNNNAKTLSQINSLHSHRNLKPVYQMQLAESMYGQQKTEVLILNSCLQPGINIRSQNRQNCLQENRFLPYFIQYIESLNSRKAGSILKCFIQSNCLMEIVEEKFPDWNSNNDNNDSNQSQYYNLFCQDLFLLFNQFMEEYSECDMSFIDQNLNQNIRIFCRSIENGEDGFPPSRTIQIFHSFCECLNQKIEAEYYEKFLRSNFFLKYETEVLRSLQFTLSDILFSSTAITSCFLEFMKDEGMKDHVDFLIMYQNFKTFSGQFNDAVALYDRFFSQRSPSFLDVSEAIQTELKQSIHAEPFSATCFDRVAAILIEYFNKTYFPQFKESRVFHEYLQNCDSKLAAARRNCPLNRPTPPSSTTTTQSGTPAKKPDSNFNICDPDLLWDRNNLSKGPLQFTFIDKYGRMNSSMEQPESSPRSTDTGRLTQFFRKISFNNSEEDKVKEDDAWRIAQSIINDVCSVTIQQEQQNGDID